MSESRGYLLPRLSLDRPVTVVMALAALVVTGAVAYTRIPLDLVPAGMEGDWLYVRAAYLDASPAEVERELTRPLEEAVATVPRVARVVSGANRGGAWANVQFQPGTDMHEAFADLRDRIDRAMPELPEEIERVQVLRWNQDDWPVMWIVASMEGDFADAFQLLDVHVRPALQRIEGVGTVEVRGEEARQVRVELDQARLRAHGVEPYEVGRRLESRNFALPGGRVLEGGRRIHVRSLGRFESLEQVRRLIIDEEHGLRLGDVAEVSMEPPPREWFSRIDGRPALGIEVMRASGGNLVEISRGVRAKLGELRRRPHLQGVDFEVSWDQGEHILESVDNLKSTALWGGLFAGLVLLFFLRAARMTLIITLAIPLSVTATVATIYFLGWSLNLITMMGLMLSLGLVVDNAIVIVENIHRRRLEGAGPREASIRGAGEVGLAVTMATLTTVVVFLPLILMSGDEGFAFIMLRLGGPVIVGLLASLVIALLIIPLAAQRIGTSGSGGDPRVIARGRAAYERVLAWVLTRRLDTTLIVLAAMASMQVPMQGLERTDGGSRNHKDIALGFRMPEGQTIEAADRFIAGVEDTLLSHRERYGIRLLETWSGSSFGRVRVILEEAESNEWYAVALNGLLESAGLRQAPHMDYGEALEDMKERILLPPGFRMEINYRDAGGDDSAVTVNLHGPDTDRLVELSKEVERRLEGIPGLLSVQTDFDRGGTELRVRLDRDQLRRYGLDPWAISGNISYALRGRELTKMHTGDGREVSVFLQLREDDRRSLDQLRNLTFRAAGGGEIPLEALAAVRVAPGLGGIRREDRQTVLAVTATATEAGAETLFDRVDEAMAGFEMPRGYRWGKGDRYERLQQQEESRYFALVLSVTFVFLLMGVLFESFVLPLSVIVAIPFSFLGVFWTLYLTGTPFDLLSGIGTVILVGVVVNNAIVLIDLANRLRAEGLDRFEALMEAGRHRFRPILMTTFTTIFGLLPMAVGNARMIGMPYAPLGRTMMGGLLASMVLTLVIVPLCYTFFDDLRELLRRVGRSAAAAARER